MLTVPLYDSEALPDAPHHVVAPGGYEAWHFDAEDDQGGLRLVASFSEGFGFHPEYLRRYARYCRWPTRHRPPLPAEYPCVSLAVYEKERLLAQFITHYPAGALGAATTAASVVIGSNDFTAASDGCLVVRLSGIASRRGWPRTALPAGQQLAAELSFRPLLHHAIQARPLFDAAVGAATHCWVLAHPLCEVRGVIRIGRDDLAREIAFRGRGYRDHVYGTAPIGSGLRSWMRGRVLFNDAAFMFHIARPADARRADQVRLIEADSTGLRLAGDLDHRFDGAGRRGLWLSYPLRVQLGDRVRLRSPRVIDSSPRRLRLVYDAVCSGRAGTALCELDAPRRLRLPCSAG